MGKIYKRQRLQHQNHHDNPGRKTNSFTRRQHSQAIPVNNKTRSLASTTQHDKQHNTPRPNQQQRPNVPFTNRDQVLLVGEGDLSFALSLKRHHKVRSITATCYDSRPVLMSKYPLIEKTLAKLQPASSRPPTTSDARTGDTSTALVSTERDWQGLSPPSSLSEFENDEEEEEEEQEGHDEHFKSVVNTYFSIDATKLSSAHRKTLRPHGPFTKIVFNFPHVGGISTDVNRQVRSNQELLVGFFKAATPLLATPSNPVFLTDSSNSSERYASDEEEVIEEQEEQEPPSPITESQILVTLFEGEPYTLWNIRDLARHSGLKVLESFKFPWSAYPGYKHARTIGDITTGKDRTDEGKRKGAWRGEERNARCYVLALKDALGPHPAPGSRKRKKADADDSD